MGSYSYTIYISWGTMMSLSVTCEFPRSMATQISQYFSYRGQKYSSTVYYKILQRKILKIIVCFSFLNGEITKYMLVCIFQYIVKSNAKYTCKKNKNSSVSLVSLFHPFIAMGSVVLQGGAPGLFLLI